MYIYYYRVTGVYAIVCFCHVVSTDGFYALLFIFVRFHLRITNTSKSRNVLKSNVEVLFTLGQFLNVLNYEKKIEI